MNETKTTAYESITDAVKDYIVKPVTRALFGNYEVMDRLDAYMVRVNAEQTRPTIYGNTITELVSDFEGL